MQLIVIVHMSCCNTFQHYHPTKSQRTTLHLPKQVCTGTLAHRTCTLDLSDMVSDTVIVPLDAQEGLHPRISKLLLEIIAEIS